MQRESLQALDGKGVIKTFPARLASRYTSLVLKEPKTKTSVRRVLLPKTVAEMLQERYKAIAKMKMVADVYSHIIDEDPRLNAQRFEEAFYSGQSSAPAAGQRKALLFLCRFLW